MKILCLPASQQFGYLMTAKFKALIISRLKAFATNGCGTSNRLI